MEWLVQSNQRRISGGLQHNFKSQIKKKNLKFCLA